MNQNLSISQDIHLIGILEYYNSLFQMNTLFQTITYVKEDFEIGMIIEGIVNDKMYQITKGKIYEIISVSIIPDRGPSITFINDGGRAEPKIANHGEFPFDRYFRIL